MKAKIPAPPKCSAAKSRLTRRIAAQNAAVRTIPSAVVATEKAHVLVCLAEEINKLENPGRGVTVIKTAPDDWVIGFVAGTGKNDVLELQTTTGTRKFSISVDARRLSARGGKGKPLAKRSEVKLKERRGSFSQVQLADGTILSGSSREDVGWRVHFERSTDRGANWCELRDLWISEIIISAGGSGGRAGTRALPIGPGAPIYEASREWYRCRLPRLRDTVCSRLRLGSASWI